MQTDTAPLSGTADRQQTAPNQGRHPVGIVTGLKSEAALLDHCTACQAPDGASPPLVAIAGGSAARAEEQARALAARGARALMSFGLGGGLDPRLTPGTLVLADGVILPDGRKVPTDVAWRSALRCREGLPVALCEDSIIGSDHAVASLEEKRNLCEQQGAVLVDMESHGVARAAEDLGLPFIVLRAVGDPAGRVLPPSALVGMDEEGNMKPLSVIAALLKRPGDLPGLIGLARESGKAMQALKALARLPLEPDPSA